MSTLPIPKQLQFRNVVPDCVHLIFHYHIFHFLCGEDDEVYLPEEPIFSDNAQEWRFLQQYAHCVDISSQPVEDNVSSLPLEDFLDYCKHVKCKKTFYYLKLPQLQLHYTDSLISKMRGIPKLTLFEETVRSFFGLKPEEQREGINESLFECFRGVEELAMNNFFVEHPPTNREDSSTQSCSSPLENLRGIRALRLGANCSIDLTDENMQNLRGIQKMVHYRFDLTDEKATHLRGIKELTVFSHHLHYNHLLTDVGFKNIRGIRVLNLSGASYANISNAAFSNLRGIRSLTISSCPNITDEIFKQLRGIEKLHLLSCDGIPFSEDTLENLRGIRELEWRNQWSNLQDSVLEKRLTNSCLKQLHGVETLDLDGVVTLGDDSFHHLSQVRHLTLEGKRDFRMSIALSDASFCHMKHLQSLDLRSICLDVTDFSKLFQDHMPELKKVGIADCLVRASSLNDREGVQFESLHISSTTGEFCRVSFRATM